MVLSVPVSREDSLSILALNLVIGQAQAPLLLHPRAPPLPPHIQEQPLSPLRLLLLIPAIHILATM